MGDLVLPVQRIIDVQYRTTGIPEYDFDALGLEAATEDFGAVMAVAELADSDMVVDFLTGGLCTIVG